MQKTKLKDIILGLDDLSLEESLEFLTKKAAEKQKKTFVVTVNPEIIMIERDDAYYEKVIKSADLALVDGVGVLFAGQVLGKRYKGRVHGVDLMENLCRRIAKQPITVGFLGGGPHVAEKTAECLRQKYPGLKISFAYEEWPENPKIQPKTDILFVAFGSPKQEKWIYEHLPELDLKVAIGVGGAFDFISGKVPRAPLFVRNLGLEWLFRLIIQPWRAKRQLSLLKFIVLVVQERLGFSLS